ncbi:hypothetical protein MMC30_003956 [Trapelia coarctata]|nr:hypothetical protein [Trapelia coarctata]
MPLHLLGKKSWNVYNVANIEKVNRDEEAAAAREAAEEQRMQEVDAERRVQALRGLQVDPLPPPRDDSSRSSKRLDLVSGSTSSRMRRRVDGEDDTERDIRYAREHQLVEPTESAGLSKRPKTSDAPLVDRSGHINLFPLEGPKRNGPKNPEAEAEAAAKKREYEDQYTMRFSNAAGFKQAIGQKPWYHSTAGPGAEDAEPPSKDVWGNEDLRRKERQKMRIVADDPLALIQKGVQDLRQVEKQRKKWREEREREMEEMARAEKRRAKRNKAAGGDGDLEDFRLDCDGGPRTHRRHRHHSEDHKHRHRHRSKDRSRERGGTRKNSEKTGKGIGWEAGPGGRYSSQFADVKS